jgi:hypothetical protein
LTVEAPAIDPATIERTLLALLAERRADSSICPSDVARRLLPAPAWRALMPVVREVAARLAAAGVVAITQRGEAQPHDAGAWRGPIRIVRGHAFADGNGRLP